MKAMAIIQFSEVYGWRKYRYQKWSGRRIRIIKDIITFPRMEAYISKIESI